MPRLAACLLFPTSPSAGTPAGGWKASESPGPWLGQQGGNTEEERRFQSEHPLRDLNTEGVRRRRWIYEGEHNLEHLGRKGKT